MKIETKFKVGDTVYFIRDNVLNKGVINGIIINIRSVITITEIYEVKFINRDYEEAKQDIGSDFLFESAKDLFDNLMLDFENSQNGNE